MTLLEINGKLCNSVEESKSSDDSGSCLAVNKPADSAVQMAHTPEFSDCEDTPALSNNIIEFSDTEETVPVSRELMDFSDREEIPAFTKNVMDFSESLKISSVSKQTVEISNKEEIQQSETEQPAIRNESLLLEQDTVAASTTDSDLLFPATALPVSNSTVSEDQISDLPVSDFDVKSATPMPPAVSLKLKTPGNQQSETEAQVLKDIICPTKTKDLNLNLVFEDLMISTVLSVLLQETIINSKARAENVGNSVKVISEETPVLFLSKEQPFNVNRVEDQLPVVETPSKETISDTTNTPQSTCNEEIPVLSEDHPKELVCGTSTFSDVNPVSKDLKTLVDPVIDTPKSSKTKENSDFYMFTLRPPVTHVSPVSMLCKPQTTINANTAAETDISCLSEGVIDLTVTNTPIISSKEDSTEQGTNVLKNTAHNAIPDLLAPESTSPETNSMHSSRINRTIKRKDIRAHLCFWRGILELADHVLSFSLQTLNPFQPSWCLVGSFVAEELQAIGAEPRQGVWLREPRCRTHSPSAPTGRSTYPYKRSPASALPASKKQRDTASRQQSRETGDCPARHEREQGSAATPWGLPSVLGARVAVRRGAIATLDRQCGAASAGRGPTEQEGRDRSGHKKYMRLSP
ncbi:hypothetical protein NDU88_000671 [Pleurodeles waltl]|uniref:Uncharacterized protein n=1 Tax=Pleurodeles waltl TaxID=8319 RepID=A0AAV7N8L9_PLEWA|nr:hypothetical protein NDU88_000671 [Pleurodeles waltl]